MRLILFIKETLADAAKVITSKKRLQEFLGISLYRNSVYLMLNSGIIAVLSFFFWVVAARLYPVEGIGFASAAISAVGLLALLSTLGLDWGLIRFLPGSGEKAGEVINTCLTIGSLVSIALSSIFLIGLHIWSPALLLLREHPIFLASFVAFTVIVTLTTFTQQTFIAKRRADFALAHGVIFGLARFIPLVTLAALFHTFGIFASWGIAMGLSLAIAIFLFLPRLQAGYRPLPTISRWAINNMKHFSLANYGASLFWAVPGLILPLIVVNLLGAESNAYFYIGWATGSVLFMIPMAVSLSLFVEGSHSSEQLKRDTRRSFKLILLLLVPAIIIVFLLGDKILALFGAAYSENATRLLWILAASALPVSINRIYFSIKRVEMRMKSVVGLVVLIASVTLALSYFLLPQMGILGAGVAWLIGQGVVAIITGYKIITDW